MSEEYTKAVAEMAEAFRAVLPIMKAVRYSVGLGANQLARFAKAEATLAEYDRTKKLANTQGSAK